MLYPHLTIPTIHTIRRHPDGESGQIFIKVVKILKYMKIHVSYDQKTYYFLVYWAQNEVVKIKKKINFFMVFAIKNWWFGFPKIKLPGNFSFSVFSVKNNIALNLIYGMIWSSLLVDHLPNRYQLLFPDKLRFGTILTRTKWATTTQLSLVSAYYWSPIKVNIQ